MFSEVYFIIDFRIIHLKKRRLRGDGWGTTPLDIAAREELLLESTCYFFDFVKAIDIQAFLFFKRTTTPVLLQNAHLWTFIGFWDSNFRLDDGTIKA